MRATRDRRENRAISDLVAFVLTFAVIVMSIGLITTVGYEQLATAQENQEIKNAERLFQLIDRDYEDLQVSRGSVRTSQLDIGEGELQFYNRSRMRITVGGTSVNRTIPLGQLRFDVDESTMTYEGGLVARGTDNRSVRRRPPTIQCTDEAAMVSVVQLTGRMPSSFESGFVKITSAQTGTEIIYPRERFGPESATAASDVTIELDTSLDSAWRRYLVQSANWTAVPSQENTYTCTADRVYVRETAIDLSFTR